MDLNEAIEKEIMEEEEARIKAEFSPKPISKTQVDGAKFAWMAVANGIDLTTAYALYLVLSPYWWYAALWVIAGAGGLMFSEWLWERVGNNEIQIKIARTSKTVSAVAILGMALLAAVVLIMGWQREQWMEVLAAISAVGLIFFHGWQAYQYHEKDDDYIAQTEDARKAAQNMKDIRAIHRAGARIDAKKLVHRVGKKYEREHGGAFVKAAGRSFASDEEDHIRKLDPPAGQSK